MIARLARCLREYTRTTLLTPLCMIGEVCCECTIPLITKELINHIEDGCEMKDITFYGLLLLAMAIASMCFGWLGGVLCAKASAGFAKNLRHDIYYKIQTFSFANIDRFSTASLVTRLTTDISNVQMAFMMIIRTAVRSPLMLIFAFCMSIAVGKRLAWIFALLIPVLGFSLILIACKAMPMFHAVFQKYDRLNNSVQENIMGIRVVKSFVRENHEVQKFTSASDDVRHDFTRAETLIALNSPIMQICVYTSMILISFFASKLIVSTGGVYLGIGSLTSMITYSMQILMSLMMLSMIFVMITLANASAKRIVEVLDEESTITPPLQPVTDVADGSVEFRHVSFKYAAAAERMALSDINLRFESGMTVGILGGTGSGKSSLVQLICRLYDATEGEVLVGGMDVRAYDLDTLRSEVAVVLQKNVLFSGTVSENLRWGNPDASEEELVRICKLAQADGFLRALPDGYNAHVEQGGSNFSGGQKQRLCIARALLKKPKILILDDSTSAVDTKTDALIRQAFRTEIPGTTKIIIAQRISSVEDADCIVVLDNGTVNGFGTHEELLASNRIYREVYESQNRTEATVHD